MPEEFDEQEIQETIQQEPESEVEAKEEARVPVSVVKELRDELRQAKEEGNLTRQQMSKLMSDYQEALRMKQPMEPQQNLDPEVLQLLKPYLKPLEDEFGKTKRELDDLKAERQQSVAERYIERNLPNIDDLKQDILKEIESYPKDEQTEILANPREIVRIGKMIQRLKGGSAASRSENRSRARTETGSTSTRLQADSDVDSKVAAWMKANGL